MSDGTTTGSIQPKLVQIFREKHENRIDIFKEYQTKLSLSDRRLSTSIKDRYCWKILILQPMQRGEFQAGCLFDERSQKVNQNLLLGHREKCFDNWAVLRICILQEHFKLTWSEKTQVSRRMNSNVIRHDRERSENIHYRVDSEKSFAFDSFKRTAAQARYLSMTVSHNAPKKEKNKRIEICGIELEKSTNGDGLLEAQ